MRSNLLYDNVEKLAKAAYGVMETPAEGLTIGQAEAIAYQVKKIVRSVKQINDSLDIFTRRNQEDFLKNDETFMLPLEHETEEPETGYGPGI